MRFCFEFGNDIVKYASVQFSLSYNHHYFTALISSILHSLASSSNTSLHKLPLYVVQILSTSVKLMIVRQKVCQKQVITVMMQICDIIIIMKVPSSVLFSPL